MLRQRILTVLILLPLFLAALFILPQWGWAVAIAPLGLAGAWEWAALAGWRERGCMLYTACLAAIGLGLWVFLPLASTSLLVAAALFWFLVAPLWMARGWRVQNPVLMALAGALLLLPLWLALVVLQRSPMQLLVLMAIVWISDSAAYFCGHQWGRRKLAPRISPGKTWEGVIGAVVAVAIYYGLVQISGIALAPVLQGISGFAVFLLLMLLGVEGDLFESWVKRVAGVKDSGTLMPGHGGALDRLDALTSSLPVAALILSLA